MAKECLTIHLQDNDVPECQVLKYDGFYTVNLILGSSSVKYFVQTEQALVNLKNRFLWAFEKPIKM
jgi:hypothetical protein